MSILQEYEYIRNGLRPGEFAAIETYLSLHKELYLSDVYYKQEEYEKFDAWWMETLNKDKMYGVAFTTERVKVIVRKALIMLKETIDWNSSDWDLPYLAKELGLTEDEYAFLGFENIEKGEK